MIIDGDTLFAMIQKISAKIAEMAADLKILRMSLPQRLEKSLLNTEDLCKILKISERTAATMRKDGSIPFNKIRRKIYYKASDIEKLITRPP